MLRYIIILFLALFQYSYTYCQLTLDSLGCVPLLVNAINPSTGGATIKWDFGDGTFSTIENASHVYIAPGQYILKCIVNGVLIQQQTINVLDKPQLNFSFQPDSGCAPLSIIFQNNAQVSDGLSPLNYFWDFGDGGSSSQLNPTYTYNHIGNFNVTLNLITNIAQCNNQFVIKNAVKILGNIDLNFELDSLANICENPRKAYFKNYSIPNDSTTYTWDFGNGMTSKSFFPPPIPYNINGNVVVSLSARDKDGCEAKISKSFNIENDTDKVNIVIPDTICLNQEIDIIQNTGEGLFEWDFGNTAFFQSSTDSLPIQNKFLTTGDKEVKLTYTNLKGCLHDTIVKIHVPQPNANFNLRDSIICELPQKITCIALDTTHAHYYWNNAEGESMYMFNENYIKRDSFYYNDSIVKSIILVVLDKNGCVGKLTKKYKIFQPNALFYVSNREGVVPFTLQLHDVSESYFPIVKYVVSWGDGTTSTYTAETIKTAQHTYSKVGNYYINMSIETSNGCKDNYYGMWVKAIEYTTGTSDFLLSFSLDTITVCTGDQFNFDKDSFPSTLDNIHLDFGNADFACDGINSYFTNSAIPGFYDVDISFEFKGNIVTQKQTIFVKGAKAKLDYKIDCKDQRNVVFRDSSFNATNTFFVIDNDTLKGQAELPYQFAEYGLHYIKLFAVNYQDSSCGYDSTYITLDLKKPKAVIEAPDFICQYQSVVLSAQKSQDAISICEAGYNWRFDHKDVRSVVTDSNRINKFLPVGLHRLSLEIRDVNGCHDTAYHQIKVIGINADFTINQELLCDSMEIHLHDNSHSDAGMIAHWKWNTIGAADAPDLKYNIGHVKDSLTWQLIVKDSLGCVDTLAKTLYVKEMKIDVRVDSIICVAKALPLFAKNLQPDFNAVQYQWIIDQTKFYSDSILTVKLDTPGWHTIDFIAKDRKTGCQVDTAFQVFLVPKPQAIISPFIDSLWCSPKTIQFYGQSSLYDIIDSIKFIWSFSNGHSSFKINPVETFNKGDYAARLITQSLYGCSDTAYTKIKVVGPTGLFEVNKEVLCNNDTIEVYLKNAEDVDNYYWDFGDGTLIYNEPLYKHQYAEPPPSGTYTIALVLQSNKDGCEAVNIKEIKAIKIKAAFDDYYTCSNTLRPINESQGGHFFQWTYNNQVASIEKNPAITFPQSGNYALQLISRDSLQLCSDTFSHDIHILRNPVIAINDFHLCGQDTFVFVKNPWTDYLFNPADIVTIVDGQIKIATDKNTSLHILATADSLCHDEKTINIDHDENEYVFISDTLGICQSPITIPIDIKAGDTIIWHFDGDSITAQNISCLDCTQPILSEGVTGTFGLTIKNTQWCYVTDYMYHIVEVAAKMPNVFSPNGDLINDLFGPVIFPRSIQNKFIIDQFIIWNRWGKEVHHSTSYWDGYSDGIPQTEDVYYFNIVFHVNDQCQRSIKGNVTLIR